MIKLGELLKNKRKEKGLVLSQASESTKIPMNLLKALEEGDFNTFASDVYLKGFLKNYARFLGLDPQKTLAIYRREKLSGEDHTFREAQKPLKEQKPLLTPGRIVFLLTIFVILSVLGFIAIQVNKIIKPPTLELKEPISITAGKQGVYKTNSDSITLTGEVEVGSKLLVNGNEVNTNNLQEFRVDNFQLKPGSNKVSIIAQSYYFSKTSEITLTVVSDKDVETEQDKKKKEKNNDDQDEPDQNQNNTSNKVMNISITVAPEQAWLVVTIDGTTEVSEVVQPETDFSFKAKESFTIYSPRPQMIQLKINNKNYSFSSQTTSIFKLENGKIVQE